MYRDDLSMFSYLTTNRIWNQLYVILIDLIKENLIRLNYSLSVIIIQKDTDLYTEKTNLCNQV